MSGNGWSPEQTRPWCEHGRANNPSARVPGFCCWCVSITVHCLWILAFLNVCLSFLHSLYPGRSVRKQCRPWQVAPARGTWLFPLVKWRNAPMRSDQVKMRGAYSAHQVWTMGQAESRASCICWCFGTDFWGSRRWGVNIAASLFWGHTLGFQKKGPWSLAAWGGLDRCMAKQPKCFSIFVFVL